MERARVSTGVKFIRTESKRRKPSLIGKSLIQVTQCTSSLTSHAREMTDLSTQALLDGFDNKIEGEVRKNSYLRRPIPITVITRRPE